MERPSIYPSFDNFLVVSKERGQSVSYPQKKPATGATLSLCLSISTLYPSCPKALALAPFVPRNRSCGRLFHKVIIRDQQVAERAGRRGQREAASHSLTSPRGRRGRRGRRQWLRSSLTTSSLLRHPPPTEGRTEGQARAALYH